MTHLKDTFESTKIKIMQQLFIGALILIGTISVIAQSSGSITYKETIKMDFDIDMPDMPEGIDLSGMLPESTSAYKELYFDGKQSVYIDSKNNESSDQELESDDGSIKIMIKMDDNEEIFFTDLNSKMLTQQTSFMGKQFLIEQQVDKPKWKLTGEKVSYLGYECHKAELVIPAIEEEESESLIVAWFAPSIQSQVGPSSYNSLPGAILMLSVDGDKHEYMASDINLTIDPTEKLTKPTKGKKVTEAEFTQLIKEKEAEMKEMSGGSFFIRN